MPGMWAEQRLRAISAHARFTFREDHEPWFNLNFGLSHGGVAFLLEGDERHVHGVPYRVEGPRPRELFLPGF